MNELFVWIVYAVCVLSGLRLAKTSASPNRGWLLVCGFILFATVAMTYLMPAIAGYTGISLWLMFWVLPASLIRQINQRVEWNDYGYAHRLSLGLRCLHPADGWEQHPQLLKALHLAQQGKSGAAQTYLQRYHPTHPRLSYNYQALRYWMRADWQGALTWFRRDVPETLIFQDLHLTQYYIRALGEMGQLDELFNNLAKAKRKFTTVRDRPKIRFLQMMALAFCGQAALVRGLFEQYFSQYPARIQQFWCATAQWVADPNQNTEEQLHRLQHQGDRLLSRAVEQRLSQQLPDPNLRLSPSTKQQLKTLRDNIHEEIEDYRSLNFNQTRTVVTYTLIVINLLFFWRELALGGSENIQILDYLGGLNPERVADGEWWRILSANFLHFGWLHLGTNMMGLFFLGPFVEANLGSALYLLTYLLSGVGSMAIFAGLALSSGQPGQILIGASASIMGIVGATGAIFLRNWRQRRSRYAAERLQLIIMIVLLQFSFDLLIPRVSFLSHFWGVVLGFLLANLCLLIHPPRSRKSNQRVMGQLEG